MAKLRTVRSALQSPAPRLTAPPKIADAFYLTREWRDLVASLKRERGAYCEAVLPSGQVCRSANRIIGDHIHERRDGGADLDRSNVRLLCFSCHQAKTAQARKARARGQT